MVLPAGLDRAQRGPSRVGVGSFMGGEAQQPSSLRRKDIAGNGPECVSRRRSMLGGFFERR